MIDQLYVIDAELLAFLESDAAMLVASTATTNQPTISRAFGARVSDDCKQLTVFVTEQQSKTLLDNIRQSGRLSLNATRVTSYESYQLKGINASIGALSPKDRLFIDNYCTAFTAAVLKLGLSNEIAQSLLKSQQGENILAITFNVTDAFCQTPGPNAGKVRKPAQ